MEGTEGHHLDPDVVPVARKIHATGRFDDLLQSHALIPRA
jgi:hypothetical protein